ncbi:MAG: hypothetical protein AB7T31_05775 [Gemmatimonadales bacterium]
MPRAHARSSLTLLFLLAAAIVATPARSSAQDAATSPSRQPLRVFLDCPCDFDHLRREVPVVDYVRDRADADLHVLITTQDTGAGGEEYVLYFIGLGELAARADTLRYVSQQFETEDEVRDGYTRTFGLGLVRYLVYTGRSAALDIDFAGSDEERQSVVPGDDPWNLWVFEASVGAELSGESRQKSQAFDASFEAGRTTEQFKIDIGFRADYEEEEFELRSGAIEVGRTREIEADAIVVWSIGPNWSWGISGAIGADQSVNQALYTEAAPALEYSFYPYTESTRRQITATYRVGVATYHYEERTIFDQISEIRPAQSLELAADFQQPWGDLIVSVEGSHFLDSPRQHRIDLFSRVEWRLLRGVNLDVRGNVARVKDQIYLSAEGLDDNEILIGQRELGTDFEYGIELGVSFTFGSIFNNVVNPRLGDGGDDFDGF